MKKISILISVIVLGFMAAFFVLPKSDFSENENRYLAKFPKFGAKTLFDGSYTRDIRTYLSDRFPLRDGFVGYKTLFEKDVLQKRLINDIYVAKDGYCIEKFTMPDNTAAIGEKFNKFAQNTKADIDIMLLPTAAEIYADKLPAYAANDSQRAAIDAIMSRINAANVNKIDMYDMLSSNKGQKLYYRLDHHWTTEGAYLAACDYLKQKGFDAMPDAGCIETVCTDFKGTIYSKLNDYTIKGEEMSAYKNPAADITLNFDNGKSADSMYSDEYLEKKDKYSYFLDNLHPMLKIENKNALSDRKLAVVKDSYANCFLPFLADNYKEIWVFDTRYYKKSVSEFINENGIKEVLVLYNINTIGTDTGVNGIY